jgi:hypothetical protein
MVIVKFDELVFILAATIFSRNFLHAAGAALFIFCMAQLKVYKLAHAIMDVHRGAGAGAEV